MNYWANFKSYMIWGIFDSTILRSIVIKRCNFGVVRLDYFVTRVCS